MGNNVYKKNAMIQHILLTPASQQQQAYLYIGTTIPLAEIKSPAIKSHILPQPLEPVHHITTHAGVAVVYVGCGGKQCLLFLSTTATKLLAIAVGWSVEQVGIQVETHTCLNNAKADTHTSQNMVD